MHFAVKSGNVRFKIKQHNQNFFILVKLDILNKAIEAVHNIGTLEATLSTSPYYISVSCQGIQDEEILDAVDRGDIKIQAVVLAHQPNSITCSEHPKEVNANLFPGVFNTETSIDPKRMVRRYYHVPRKEGKTWKTLTRDELCSGDFEFYETSDCYWYVNGATGERYHAVAVELFVSGVGIKRHNPFDFEDQGIISNIMIIDTFNDND